MIAAFSLADPAGLWLLALAVPVILLHVLRPRRQRVTVSSTFLWRAIERPVSSANPWQKLRWSLLLIAQLLAVALLAVAVSRPVRLEASALSGHTVFIIDASGSMAATDGTPDRVAAAEARAVELRSELPSGGVASIVVASDRPRVVLTASDDPDAFNSALRGIQTTTGNADFRGAFDLAASLDTSSSDIGFVLLSDGGLTTEEQAALPAGTRYEKIGRDSPNRGVRRVDLEPRGSGLHVRATIQNYGDTAVTQQVRIDVDGATVNTQSVKIGARAIVTVDADVPAGDRVEVYLDGGDALAADDVGVAVGAHRPALRVLLVGESEYWQQLFGSMPDVETTVAATGAGTGAGQATPDGDGYDVVVYGGVAVPAEPKAPFLAVAPQGSVDGVTVTGVADQPVLTLLRGDDPLLADLDLSRLAIAQAQRVTTDASVDVLAAAERAPLLMRGVHAGRRFVYLSFHLADSNLPLQVAFPILGDRILTELSGAAQTTAALTVGDALPVDPSTAATVTDPQGRSRDVAAGEPAPRADQPGFWTVAQTGSDAHLVAVNPAVSESDLRPRDTVVPPADDGARATTPAQTQRSLLAWVVWPLVALLVLEGWLAWRRLGVSRRQWRWALAARVAVAALLLGALVAPTLRRASDRVATVFLVDGSASMGSAGSTAALDYVRAAMRARPDDALASVVVFGRDARLDRVMEASSSFDGTAVVVDQTATDVAAALRLGSAVLPADAKRRIVLVSDGRANTGDALEEARRIAGSGVQVDVHTVDAAAGNDAAVTGIDVPRLVRVGDSYTVTVHVNATQPGPATVVLRRDDVEVASKVVDLAAGDNAVTFTDEAGSTPAAVLRYQAVVTRTGDSQPQNDAAFAAVPVDGPARVLVVQGSDTDASGLVAALNAGGIATDVVAPSGLPAVAELATYSGVVLDDVNADDLTATQIDALSTAVRDLGRGLVTVGGPHSYGVGGYRDSPLGDLLPVDSEILDPKRRKTVAEVLSIDTSGSMAACHCSSGGMNPNVASGGINKTDISKAAAERTIEALAATDQIGVMAWTSSTDWVIDLQPLPSQAVIDEGLGRLRPNGGTDLRHALDEPAEKLLASNAELKHIILFTDGFTDVAIIRDLETRAADLYEQSGITVSVLATGEGAAPSLRGIADAGHGRFYPGTNLADVPQIMAEEAVIASRDFINEGRFLPEVTSNDPVVAPLSASPDLLGYVATTPKGGASTLLRIGPDRDPLLATWQAGLGRVTSWTSDAGSQWGQQWTGWDGYVGFWSRVVKSTFQDGDQAGAAQATIRGGVLDVSVEGASNFPDGAQAVATVSGPDGQRFQVGLERTGGNRFQASLPANRNGTYAVGVSVTDGGDTVLASSTLASASYPAEFTPGASDATLLQRVSDATGGRGEVAAADVWSAGGLPSGRHLWRLAGPFLLLAALLWPLAVALSRLSLRGATMAGTRAGLRSATGRMRAALPRVGATDPENLPARPHGSATTVAPKKPPQSTPAAPPTSQTAAVNELLERKRARQQRADTDDS